MSKNLDPITFNIINEAKNKLLLHENKNNTITKKSIKELNDNIRILSSLILLLIEKQNKDITNEEIIGYINECNKSENSNNGKCNLNLIKEKIVICNNPKIKQKRKIFKKNIRSMH